MLIPFLSLPQAIHQRDELAERVGEVEEELTMAIQEIKKLDSANKQMSDVSKTIAHTPTFLYVCFITTYHNIVVGIFG